MKAYKLEKDIKLFKVQFDKYCLNLFQEYRLDRLSLDVDGLLFKIKYMVKHNKDLDKIPELQNQFTDKARQLHASFGEFLYMLICQVITIPEPFKLDDLEDVLAQDVKIDSTYVKFKMVIISRNKDFLEYIDNAIPEDEVYNIDPNEYFRFNTDSYNDGIAKAYPELFENRQQDVIGTGADADIFVHNVTLQTSERCSLNCTYCYQFNKTPMRMSFETAKTFIDNMLNDKYGYVNRYNSPALILEFIGGEPLLEVKLTRKIYEYFLDQCYKLDHPWFTLHRVSICSNGLQYFDPEVQDFFKEYAHNISFNISIDGNKELHDACRIQPNGEGSYDIDIAALNHYNKYHTPERNSKMTLAPSNIKYLYDSVVNFIENGMTCININCVFEEGWNQETALIEYQQLKKLADYILENNLEHLYIAIFNERQEDMHSKYNDSTSCGGNGSMLALRPNGQFYPCIRYMPTSVGCDVKDLCIGTIESGIIGREQDSEILKMMDRMTRRSGTNDICFECPISNDCGGCLALGHTVFGTPNKKTTFTCLQMFAEHLANVYYFNNMLLKNPQYRLPVRKIVIPDEWSLLVIDNDELEMLKLLECQAIISTIEYENAKKLKSGD